MTRLEAKRFHADGRPAGLNLTRASLDATTKYPWQRGESVWGTRKFGVYAADLPVYEWFREGVDPGVRCIEADVMDWADDVAYSVHDIEDAIASRTIDPRMLHSTTEVAVVFGLARTAYAPDLDEDDFARALDRLLATGVIPGAYGGTRADLAVLKDMTSRLISRFVLSVERATREKHGDGPLTRYDAHLVVPDDVRAEASVLKALAAHFVMFAEERVGIMARQREVVAELVGWFAADPDRLDDDLRADHDAAVDDAERLRVVVDQVASLTDGRALAIALAGS
jgi:dGTPase